MSSKFFSAYVNTDIPVATTQFEVFTDILTDENDGTILDMRSTHFQISAHTNGNASAGTLTIEMKTHENNQYEDLPGLLTSISLIGTGATAEMVTISVPNIYLYSLRFTQASLTGVTTYGVVISQGQM